MASLVSIWNLALSHIGNKAGLSTTSPPHATVEAERCAMYWPVARQFAITKCKPSWARKRITAALVDLGDEQPSQWLYAYAKPSDALEILGVYEPEGTLDEDAKGATFEEWNDGTDDHSVIYTNVEQAVVRYLQDVEDADKYHPTFALGVSWLLASYLAGPTVKGAEGMKLAEKLEQKAIAYLNLSETQDAQQTQRRDVFRDGNHVASWISARGFGDVILGDAPVIYGEE